MADTLRLPSTCMSKQSLQDRRPDKKLNPIVEEDSDDGDTKNEDLENQSSRGGDLPHLKITAWLSPMSDHFPTPRGINFLSAPILPSSPSTVSVDGSSPTTSSNPWNRVSVASDNTEFEDLYDVSEPELEDIARCSQQASSRATLTKQPVRLVIPDNRHDSSEEWTAVDELRKITSPIPLTPSARLPMSPAQMNFMDQQQALDVPTVSAPPSLDGSLSSEQLAAMSAPPTPVIGDDEDTKDETWAGVHLQPDALATLQALSGAESDVNEQPSHVIDISLATLQPVLEMQQQPLRLVTSLPNQSAGDGVHAPNPNRQSLACLTRLDIPSPSGFFAGLSPRSRNTWHPRSRSPADLPPPTSTTAEQFYRCPWNIDISVPQVPRIPDSAEEFYRGMISTSEPVEQVVEIQDDDDLTDGMPTARPLVNPSESGDYEPIAKQPTSPVLEEAPTEIVVDYDPNYARKQQQEALSNLDRTELWLMAQRIYLKGVDENESLSALVVTKEALEEEVTELENVSIQPGEAIEAHQKVVRFSNAILATGQPERLPSRLLRQESAYYRAFQDYIVRTQLRDVFVQQLSRFEALQAQRSALREMHRNQLLGKYQLSVIPQSAKKRLSANVARGDHILTDDPEKLRKEKEFEAMYQMAMPTWHVAAIKFLNGGRLIRAPVTKRLEWRRSGVGKDRARILDLGGQSTGDWAWHCALQYPNAKIYTVTTKAIRQLSNSNIRGPSNHRQVAVERLTKLPFADSQFDLISARELHSILKFVGENGEDEWERCLRECMRVLKPGGYLEFSMIDSDIINAGPIGLAKSVEFSFDLRTLGYDPNPSKMWIGRLSRAGFDDIRRAWMFLPLGARRRMERPPTPPVGGGRVCQMDAVVMGSSDNIASVCSIVGGWSWERWLLRCEMEKVAGELRLADTVTTGTAMREAGKCLEGVHAVMEEGRGCRAGFRMLNGYARKPRATSDVIQIALAC